MAEQGITGMFYPESAIRRLGAPVFCMTVGSTLLGFLALAAWGHLSQANSVVLGGLAASGAVSLIAGAFLKALDAKWWREADLARRKLLAGPGYPGEGDSK